MITTNKPQIPITGKETVEQLMLIQQVNSMNIKKIDFDFSNIGSSNNKHLYLIFDYNGFCSNILEFIDDVAQFTLAISDLNNKITSTEFNYNLIIGYNTSTSTVGATPNGIVELKNILIKYMSVGTYVSGSKIIGYHIELN